MQRVQKLRNRSVTNASVAPATPQRVRCSKRAPLHGQPVERGGLPSEWPSPRPSPRGAGRGGETGYWICVEVIMTRGKGMCLGGQQSLDRQASYQISCVPFGETSPPTTTEP
jgi:hypothetical protein